MTLYYKNNKATIRQLLNPDCGFLYSKSCISAIASSQLLLRNMPIFFRYSASSALYLSSRSRSNSKAFCHILPCIAPVCEGMHYHRTEVPWQTKQVSPPVFFIPHDFFCCFFCQCGNQFIFSHGKPPFLFDFLQQKGWLWFVHEPLPPVTVNFIHFFLLLS